MASEAIAMMDLLPLACIVISLGHMLIDPSFGCANAIAFDVHEAAAAADDDGNGSATA